MSLFQNSRILLIVRNLSYIIDESLLLQMYNKHHAGIFESLHENPGPSIRHEYGPYTMWIRRKIRWQHDCKSPVWITAKYGVNMAVYVQSMVDKWLFVVRLQLFTEHGKLSLGNTLGHLVELEQWHHAINAIVDLLDISNNQNYWNYGIVRTME